MVAATIVSTLVNWCLLAVCVVGGLAVAGVIRLDTWRDRARKQSTPDATAEVRGSKAKPKKAKPAVKATPTPEPARAPAPAEPAGAASAPKPAKAKAAKPKAPTPAPPPRSPPPPAEQDPELTACKAHVKEGSAHVERARAQLEAERRARDELAAAAAAKEEAEEADEADDDDDDIDDDDDDDDDDELDLSVVQSEGEWKSAKRAPKRPSPLDPKARAKAVAERKAAKAVQREVDATNLRNRKKREKKREKELAVRESLRQRVVVSSKY